MKKFALWTISILLMTLIAGALLKAVDVAIGAMAEVQNPIFPPGIKGVRFKTSEFDILMKPNKFGFRGAEPAIRPGQIAVLGDSFTVGWGLGDEETWPSRLKTALREKGRDVDVYNLGKAGTDTLEQVEIARSYIPLLKPSLVILSVVQGDDIAGIAERTMERPAPKSLLERVKPMAERAFPHLLVANLRLLRGDHNATATWPQLSANLVDEGKLRLDPAMLKEALAGNVNPFLLSFAAAVPSRNDDAYGASPAAVAARDALRDAVVALSRIVAENGGHLIILSMPSAPFVASTAATNHRRFGFRMDEASFVNKAPDEFIAALCKEVGSGCVLVLDEVRALAKRQDVFFPLDGHLNAVGAQLIADRLVRDIAGSR